MDWKQKYETAKSDHRIACVGTFITFDEFMAEPEQDRIRYCNWLDLQARDVRRESRRERASMNRDGRVRRIR